MEISAFIPGLEIARDRLEVLGASKLSKPEADILFKKIIKRLFPSIRKCRESGHGWGTILAVIYSHTGADIPEPFLVRQYDLLKSFTPDDVPQEQPKRKRTRKKKSEPEPGVMEIGLKSIRIDETFTLSDGERDLLIPGERPQQPR